MLATAGSLGIYGLGWLLHQLGFAVTGNPHVPSWLGPQVGGLYWAMTWLLPGYVLFRYPAKLLVLASLGLSLLAALGWERAWNGWAARLRMAWMTLAVVSLLAAAAVVAGQAQIRNQFRSATPDTLLGPLDVDGAWRDLLTAFCHAAIVCVLLWLLWSGNLHAGRTVRQLLAMVVLAVELTVAQAWTVPHAPQDLWQRPSAMAVAASQHSGDPARPVPVACLSRKHPPMAPTGLRETSSTQRQIEGLHWDRDTLFPRHQLTTEWALVESHSSFVSADLEQLLAVARRYGQQRPDGVWEPPRPVLDALASQYLILPDGLRYDGTTPVPVRAATDNARLWHNPHSQTRAWIVHDVVQLPASVQAGPEGRALRTRQVLLANGQPRDLAHCAVVESDAAYWRSAATRLSAAGGVATNEVCRLVHAEPLRLELHVQLARPGLVVLSDLFYPGWQAKVQSRHGQDTWTRVPILRTNRVMRGVYLPAGAYRLVYVYRPWEFYVAQPSAHSAGPA